MKKVITAYVFFIFRNFAAEIRRLFINGNQYYVKKLSIKRKFKIEGIDAKILNLISAYLFFVTLQRKK